MKTLAKTLTGRDRETLRSALPALGKVLEHAEYNSFAGIVSAAITNDTPAISEYAAQLRGVRAFGDLCASLSPPEPKTPKSQ